MRQPFGVEKSIRIFKENSDTDFFDILFGSAAPGGDGDEQDAAPIGSFFSLKSGTASKVFQKIKTAGNTGDWRDIGSTIQLGTFRPEKIRVVTSEAVGNGVRDLTASPFTDDEAPLLDASDFAVGEFIIDDSNGAPVLREVINVSAPNITLASPDANLNPLLSENDTFISPNYLPDTPGDQEGQAIVQFNGTIMAKVGDVNWNFADGITLNGAIVDRNGPVVGTDTVQVGMERLEGDSKDVHTALGIVRGAINFGSFVIGIFTANLTLKPLLQRIEDLFGQLRGVSVPGITALATVDSVLVDNVKACKWLIQAFEEANPSRVKSSEIYAMHNGTASADADDVDDNESSILKFVPSFNLTLSVDINGVGAAQVMRLRASSSTAGVTVTVRRIEVRVS